MKIIFSYFVNLFSSENDQDPGFVRLVRVVLAVSTAATTLIAIAVALSLQRAGLWASVAVIATMAVLSGISLFLSFRNILWPGKIILPLAILVGVTFLAINANGLHDSAIVGFTFVIIIASLITGQKAIPSAAFFTLLGVWIVAYADKTGINHSILASRTGWDDIAVVSIIQIVSAASLNGLMARLNAALATSRANEQAQIEANQELRQLQTALELRVAERTKALSTVAEISTAASTILETDKLLQTVVDLSKERFGFYHAHIYLLNDTGDTLVLASGAGEPGRKMVAEGRSIPLDREQSLVARAAREKTGVIVNDVTEAPDFLPNPLLPNTRSELAVPMMVGEQVIGVLDVQSDQVGRFTDAEIAIQTTLASQVASAVQNARSYTEIRRNEGLLSEALNVSRLGNWEYDLEKDLFTFNDQFYSVFRTTAEIVGGYKMSSADYAKRFVHPDDAPLVGTEIQRSIESKERHFKAALEHRVIFPDGEIGYISVRINLERDENGKIIRWSGANQDVTERKRAEQEATQRARHQEALNTITQKIQSATTVEAALQVAARELGHALGKKSTLVALEPSALSMEHKSPNKNE